MSIPAFDKILHYPDPRLAEKCVPVEMIDDTVVGLLDAMLVAMYEHDGVGLASRQLGLDPALIVWDVSPERNEGFVLAGPEIVSREGEEKMEEGCLSVPGIRAPVKRSLYVRVKGLDRRGEEVELDLEGLPARVIQHEIDHLNGILFIQRIGAARKLALRHELARLRRSNERDD